MKACPKMCTPSNETLCLVLDSHTKFIPSVNHTGQVAVCQHFVSTVLRTRESTNHGTYNWEKLS